MTIDFPTVISKFDEALSRGLSNGLGDRDGQMCIEAAICYALDLPHGDNPQCVAESVRAYKIQLNDAKWFSPKARAKGLRDLGIAQLGSKGIVSDSDFNSRMAVETIRVIIPTLFREVFPKDTPAHKKARAAGEACGLNPTRENSRLADAAAYAAAYAADATTAAYAAAYAAAAYAANATAAAIKSGDKYLLLSASIALQVLRGLNSPGCEWV